MGFIEKDNGNNPIVPVATMPNANSVNQGNVGASSTASSVDGAGASASSDGAGSSAGIQIPKAQEGFTQQPGPEAASTEGAGNIQLIDWSKPYSEIEQNDQLRKMKPIDIVKDYQKNGKGDWATFMPWLSQYADPNKSVQLNMDEAQAAQRKEKMEKWGNFLLHLGNFFGTTQGAPAQKLESAQELTERQRKLREGTEALRQKGYDQILANIYKERADRQAQLQAEADEALKKAQMDYYIANKKQVEALTGPKVKVQETMAEKNQSQTNLTNAKTDFTVKTTQPTIDKLNRTGTGSSSSSRVSSSRGGSSTGGRNRVNPNDKYDEFAKYYDDKRFRQLRDTYEKKYGFGQGKTKKTWNTVAMGQFVAQAKALEKHDRTSPSRRQGAGNKVPPSRRGNAGGGSKVPPSRR